LKKNEKKISDLRQPQLGKNLKNCQKDFELWQPQLGKNGKIIENKN